MNPSEALQLLKRISFTDDRVLPADPADQAFKAEEWAYQLGDATLDEAITAYRDMSRLMTSTPTIRDIVARARDNAERQSRHQRQLLERQLDTNPLEQLDS